MAIMEAIVGFEPSSIRRVSGYSPLVPLLTALPGALLDRGELLLSLVRAKR